MTVAPFTIAVYESTVNADILNEAVALYQEVYAEPPYCELEEDFATFALDLARRKKEPSFRLAIAFRHSLTVGFALGHQLSESTQWWTGAEQSLPAEVVTEYSGRTFAVIELAVSRFHRRIGIGTALHEALVVGLLEERSTLLVRPDAPAAQATYQSLGYRKIGKIKPLDLAPTYDAMIRTLRRTQAED